VLNNRADDAEEISLILKNVIPAPKDNNPKCAGGGRANSKYIRTVRVKNDRLSTWWGRAIYLEACVLLPFGFDEPEHKDAKYPLVVAHGHYSSEWNAGGRFAEKVRVRVSVCPCLSVYRSICWSVCLSVCVGLSAGSSVCLPVCLSFCRYVGLSACLLVCLPAYLSVCLSVCLVYLFVCLFVCLSVSHNCEVVGHLCAHLPSNEPGNCNA
jgi:hypothetical protein